MSAILLNVVYSGYAGVSIKCGFGNYEFPDPRIGAIYSCNNAEITFSADASRNVTAITGGHQAGKDNSYVYGIRLSNLTQLTFMPRLLETWFPNMYAIQISNTNLFQLSQADLKPFPQLLFFKAYGSNLETIDANLFAYNPLLRSISFNSNHIKNIGKDTFTNLNQLSELFLSGNDCINKWSDTRDGVVALTAQLPNLCPPLQCTQNISDNEDLMTEIQELKQTIRRLKDESKTIGRLLH